MKLTPEQHARFSVLIDTSLTGFMTVAESAELRALSSTAMSDDPPEYDHHEPPPYPPEGLDWDDDHHYDSSDYDDRAGDDG